MFETGIRQFRIALAMTFGRPLNISVLERLVEDALATLTEFGAPGDGVQELLDGPFTDPATRRDLQDRALRRTAARLASRSSFYRARFAAAGVRVDRLTSADLPRIPVTRKGDLRDRPLDFVCGHPYIATPTTGTSGRPVRIWLSRYEMGLWPALIALSMLLRGELGPDDCMQLNVSSRATSTVEQAIRLCGLTGAACRVVGLVPPDECLDQMITGDGPPPTVLNTYPSYLGQLVTAARRRGHGPGDFALRTIYTGGEILSYTLAEAAREMFGADQVSDVYGMTEIVPVGGRTCGRRHLHLDPAMGYAEVLDLRTGEPVPPGSIGTLVVTPYFPYRECMPVFRYDTRDVVRWLADGELDCELAGVPAVSEPMGKAERVMWTREGPVTPRDIIEVLEGGPDPRWPARFEAAVAEDGRLQITLPMPGADSRSVVDGFTARGIGAVVNIGSSNPWPLRCDLCENTFTASRSV